MSIIQAYAISQYTSMMNNSAYNIMRINNSRMNMLSPSFMNNVSFGSLAAIDNQYELDTITYGLQYRLAKAMLEQAKKQQKEDAKSFSIFA